MGPVHVLLKKKDMFPPVDRNGCFEGGVSGADSTINKVGKATYSISLLNVHNVF